jgi:hypothetical protein
MNKKEYEFLEIPQMEIDFPTKQERQQQVKQILVAAMPEKQSLPKRLKNIYWGPGWKVIFYHCESVWLITVFVYIGVFLLGRLLGTTDIRIQMAMSVLEYPICYLVFSFLSCWLDEQEAVAELKNTMRYSMTYIVSLRMLYTSILLIMVNIIVEIVIDRYQWSDFLIVSAIGTSSMFLFAMVSLYFYHKYVKSYYMGILIGLWLVLAAGIRNLHGGKLFLIVQGIPIAIHIGVAVVCFIFMLIYIGKVEKKDAYTFAY